MQTAQITAATPSIKCSIALNTFLTPQKRKSWHFNPKPVLTHRIGSQTALKVKAEASKKLVEIRNDKTKQKQFLALRKMVTLTGKICKLNQNGKLQIGGRYATKPEQSIFAQLI